MCWDVLGKLQGKNWCAGIRQVWTKFLKNRSKLPKTFTYTFKPEERHYALYWNESSSWNKIDSHFVKSCLRQRHFSLCILYGIASPYQCLKNTWQTANSPWLLQNEPKWHWGGSWIKWEKLPLYIPTRNTVYKITCTWNPTAFKVRFMWWFSSK